MPPVIPRYSPCLPVPILPDGATDPHPLFPPQLPPSLASVRWWSAQCLWGVGSPARLPWKWPHTPSCSSSAQVPPRTQLPPSLPSPSSPVVGFFSCCGSQRGRGTHLPLVPPLGPQPPHLTLCHRLGDNSCPGPGVPAGRTQLRRGALWHHGPTHRSAGAEGPCAAHRLQVRGSLCIPPLLGRACPLPGMAGRHLALSSPHSNCIPS